MSSIVEISAATPSVACDAKGVAQHVVNVHNISGRKLRVGARIVADGDTKAQWFGAIAAPGKEQQSEWDLAVDQTIQLTIPIAAKDAAPAKYTFRIEIYSTDMPSEDFTTGDGIAFEVSPPEPDKEPAKGGGIPWWVILIIVLVGLAVVGGGGWAIYAAMSKTHVPDVMGLSLEEAKKLIEEKKLQVGTVKSEHRGNQPKNTVIDQVPDADEKVKKGTAVDLVTEKGAAPQPVTPAVHKRGRFNVRQTWMADLDEGSEVSNGADFWFEAVTATERYLVPRNGAQMVRMGSQAVDYKACTNASLATARIRLQSLPAGTFLCARTNQGRISAVRVENNVGPSPGVLTISFTTWEKPLIIMPIAPSRLRIIGQ
jgi:hypothetical protein